MRFGVVGLGRIGRALAGQALERGHEVVGYDPDGTARSNLESVRGEAAVSLAELAEALPSPRLILIYVPHGEPVDATVTDLASLCAPGDLVVDGGNSHWRDSLRRHSLLAEQEISFCDMGTSGGVQGAERGACFMVGGSRENYEMLAPLLTDLAVDERAVAHAGPAGAGHFVKLVHNAIEFGMIQSIAEGVELLQRSGAELGAELDLPALFENWSHGSVIRSWLVQLMGSALASEDDFAGLSTFVEDTGEVKWVLDWALDRDVPTPAVSAAQNALMGFRDTDSPAAKSVALLRNQFGEHPVHRTR